MRADDDATVERIAKAGDALARWAEDARGHYGIEECSVPGQPSTEWDEIQDGLAHAAEHWRATRAALTAAQGDEAA